MATNVNDKDRDKKQRAKELKMLETLARAHKFIQSKVSDNISVNIGNVAWNKTEILEDIEKHFQ